MLTPDEVQWIGNKFDKLDRRLEEVDNRLKHIAEKAQRIVEIEKSLTKGWLDRLTLQLELQELVREIKEGRHKDDALSDFIMPVRQETTGPVQYRDAWGHWLPPGVVPDNAVTATTAQEKA